MKKNLQKNKIMSEQSNNEDEMWIDVINMYNKRAHTKDAVSDLKSKYAIISRVDDFDTVEELKAILSDVLEQSSKSAYVSFNEETENKIKEAIK